MDLTELSALAADLPAFADWNAAPEGVQMIAGLPPAAKALLLARTARQGQTPLALVTYNADTAARLAADLEQFGVQNITVLPSTVETLFFTEGHPDAAQTGTRVAALQALARHEARVVVGPIGAWLQRTPPPDALAERRIVLKTADTVDIRGLETTLTAYGYERVEAVEQAGQWTRRGGIVDIYPADAPAPVRIDFFGDDVESVRAFDSDTQRSQARMDSVTVAPVRETDYANADVSAAVAFIQKHLPARLKTLRDADLEGRGAEHAERLEERMETDIAQLHAHAFFDTLEQYASLLYPGGTCALDFLPADALLVIDEPPQAQARWEQTEREVADILGARAARGEALLADADFACGWDAVVERVAPPAPQVWGEETTNSVSVSQGAKGQVRSTKKDRGLPPPKLGGPGGPVLFFSLLGRGIEGVKLQRTLPTQAGAMENFGGRMASFFDALDGWRTAKFRTVIVTEQTQRMRMLLAERKVSVSPADRLEPGGEGGVFVIDGALADGFKLPEARLLVATDTDVFGHRAHKKAPRRKFTEGLKITSYLELREGDYVVHITHGIGRYGGLSRLKGPDGGMRDFLLLQYADNDKVYVPTDQVDRVQKYIGSADNPPEVTRLHSGDWARATSRAKKQVQAMAAELIKLYAARKAAARPPLPPDSPWQSEMEEAFPYQETPDQMAAVEDVKADLQDDKPMDRLICGDVGYGKTEVAIRAAFKVASDGRQVAVLCPTTILAQQHLKTFRARLAAYPVNVQMVSRFVLPAETKKTMQGLADGTVDIVIGTHKLLGAGVKFHKLGLLIVDEEQRFGVTHKERIKTMKKNVDVLTLTATPIPRTLHMSLSGIRDMSLIDDPPEGRLPIQTHVREYDDELVREVVLRELDRGGQVYFLHNRVESIAHVAEKVRRLVPSARVELAHGQMHADDLEDVMARFADGDFNVLVCTTIVESGLDIPNVNTIIVDNADRLGLAQLYQIRGRIGRARRQAYAYFLWKRDKQLSETAEKRLGALREFSDLGSGYKVALRDLEIRGAGNLLGAEQSGTVSTVGFDLYTQLLSQAINQLKGEPEEEDTDLPNVALPLDALIPTAYIPSEAERILMYKKLAAAKTRESVQQLQDELEDRYGDPPRTVWNLLAILRLRLRCKEVGIGSVVAEKRRVAVRFRGTHLTPDLIKQLSRKQMQHQFLPDVVFLATSDAPAAMLRTVEEMVEVIAEVLPPVLNEEKPKPKPAPPVDDEPAPRPRKPKPAPVHADTAQADSRTRNLVTNQISARRRGR